MNSYTRRNFLKVGAGSVLAGGAAMLGCGLTGPTHAASNGPAPVAPTRRALDVKIAGSPINWGDDDFPILGEDTHYTTILQQMQEAGFDGTELSNKLPNDPAQLRPVLQTYDLELAAAWHCSYFLLNSLEDELKSFANTLHFLKQMGTSVVVVAECTYCPFKPPDAQYNQDPNPLNQNFPALTVDVFPYALPTLTAAQWKKIGDGFTAFGRMADDAGIKMGYHPHMQTVVQDLDQIEKLLDAAPDLQLTIDTGHLAFAGVDVYAFVEKYRDRAVHYHMKNIRPQVTELARQGGMSFEWAVVNGCFTVPGDGGLDFKRIFRQVSETPGGGFEGWWVVEAEQNPLTSNPYLYATLARNFISLEIEAINSGN